MHKDRNKNKTENKSYWQGRYRKDKNQERIAKDHSQYEEESPLKASADSQQEKDVLWIICLLGVWMLCFPHTFSYELSPAVPPGGRDLWLSDAQRIACMTWSDMLAGSIIMLSGLLCALRPRLKIVLWAPIACGVWLTIAPLVFWSPSAAGYLNDTCIGALVIALIALSGKLPGMQKPETISSIPEGWTYNPSAPAQRWPMLVGGFTGLMLSRYLAAYQLGYIPQAWDPLFGEATMKVLNSPVSRSLPVSDAGIGAVAYTFEFLLGLMGGASRWRTKPWLVFLFGMIIIPVGFAHVFLAIAQPVIVGNWCCFCLLAAMSMLSMITLGIDEIAAMIQFIIHKRKEGMPILTVFLQGEPDPQEADVAPLFPAATRGVSFSVYTIVSIIAGLVLTVFSGMSSIVSHSVTADIIALSGLLIIVFSILSSAAFMRKLRFFCLLIGAGIAAVIWFAPAPTVVKVVCAITGIIVALSSIPLKWNKERYGMWEKYI